MPEQLLLVPRVQNVGEHYWSPDRFDAWARHVLGTDPTRADVAALLNISPQMVSYLMRGARSPGLEVYLRMLAEAGEPVGAWVDHVDVVHNVSLAERHGWA